MRVVKSTLGLAAVLMCSALLAENVQGQTVFGAELVLADDLDLGIGGRIMHDIDAFSDDEDSVFRELRFIGEFIYYLDPFDHCNACGAWEIDGNGAVPLDLGEADLYAGAGLHITRFSYDSAIDVPGLAFNRSNTEVGLNLLGGLNFDLGTLSAFAEVGIQLGGAEQFTIKGGIALGGS